MEKRISRKKRAKRVRAKVKGTAVRPRLTVFKSLTQIYAQLIDDEKGVTLASFDTGKMKGAQKYDIAAAHKAGVEIAKMANEKHIKEVVFDRHGYRYHGKVKALAEGAREAGLKF